MNQIVNCVVFVALLFVGMLAFLELGRRLGQRYLQQDPNGNRPGLGAIDAAVFSLLGLLVAFTFSGAASRFDARRSLIVDETNNIGTAWLRLDLVPAEQRAPLKDSFRRYVEARLEVYQAVYNTAATKDALARSNALQTEIWSRAIAATQNGGHPSAAILLLPALNDMIDITTTRTAAMLTHPPVIIYAALAVVALVSSLLAGFGMAGGKARSWLHTVGFAAITAGAIYVILDLEFPRLGLIRIDDFDQLLRDLRTSMN